MIKINHWSRTTSSECTVVFGTAVSGCSHLYSALSFSAYTLTISGQIVAFVAQIRCKSVGIAARFATTASLLWNRVLSAFVLLSIGIFSLADLREQHRFVIRGCVPGS